MLKRNIRGNFSEVLWEKNIQLQIEMNLFLAFISLEEFEYFYDVIGAKQTVKVYIFSSAYESVEWIWHFRQTICEIIKNLFGWNETKR